MTYLVDANVLSETTKPEPDERVVVWLRQNEAELVIDSIVLGEILIGILKLPGGRKRDGLEEWFERAFPAILVSLGRVRRENAGPTW